jgi:hypothetical protein
VAAAILWVGHLPFDSERAAAKASQIFGEDRRVKHFYDDDELMGQALSTQFRWSYTAWDFYLFYDPDARWEAAPPVARTYLHQMGRYMDDEHFHSGPDLIAGLGAAAREAFAAPPPETDQPGASSSR